MTTQPRLTTAGSTSLIRDLQRALLRATNEHEALAAVGAQLGGLGPERLTLYAPLVDAEGRPAGLELACQWTARLGISPRRADGPAIAFSELPLPVGWVEQGLELMEIADVLADVRCDAAARALFASQGIRAAVLLPLFSAGDERWQGLLTIGWSATHEPTPEERHVYTLVQFVLAPALAHRRAERAIRQTRNEIGQFYTLSDDLNAAPSVSEAFEAAAIPAVSRGATTALLMVLERDAHDEPVAGVVTATFDLEGGQDSLRPGARVEIDHEPLARRWIESPATPLLIEDVEADPRVDPRALVQLRARRQRAVAVLPLVSQGRLVGALTFAWPVAQSFSDRDHRLYRTIARAAATTLDNRLLVEAMERAARASAQQAALFRTVLEHLPVGVWVAAAPGERPLMANRRAVDLLGSAVDPAGAKDAGDGAPRFLRAGTSSPLSIDESPIHQAALAGRRHDGEADIVTPIGERRSLELVSAPIVDPDGQARGVLTCVSDVTVRKNAEADRQRMQDELIAAQTAALAERSTPLIPITADIVVVPLIGTVDRERGRQLMETALEGVTRRRSRVLIIDITGVPTLDAQGATYLVDTARALRLLGATPILTGVRPETAQTLVECDVDLAGVVLHRSLDGVMADLLRRPARR